jgi:hypothetical protein
VEIAVQRFRQIAARRLGIRGTSKTSEIVDAMSQRGIAISESAANLVRQSEFAAGDMTLTGKSAIALVRALNEATRAMAPASKKTAIENAVNRQAVEDTAKERD